MTTLWLVAILSLTLPAEYRLGDSRSERFPLVGPPGLHTNEDFRSWNAPGGKSVYLFYWSPQARDLGPMVVAAEWPARVAGQDTRIIETSMFMGRPQRVLVVHLAFSAPRSTAMVYATGLERRDFESLLAGLERVERPKLEYAVHATADSAKPLTTVTCAGRSRYAARPAAVQREHGR